MRCVSNYILLSIFVSLLSCGEDTSYHAEDSSYYVEPDDVTSPNVGDIAPEPDTYSIWSDPCVECSWYFCPPLDAIWQKQLCHDVCQDPTVLVYEGECVEYLDCNPAQPVIQTDLPCTTEEGFPGVQDELCDKGQIYFSECITECADETCNGIDDDCDGVVDNGFSGIPELCNNVDDNCNGLVDEDLEGVCETDCGAGVLLCLVGEEVCLGPDPVEEVCDGLDNDCDGETDEGQLNACGTCGLLPQELCDDLDNDCDGLVDEDLVEGCSTECGEGYTMCISGGWSACSADVPQDETCDGLDNDCDGLVDEGLDCQCPAEMIGFLMPCMEEPLVCGQGYKTCQCNDPTCSSTSMTPCFAACWWIPTVDPACDPLLGMVAPEACNNFDDNCNQLVDEDLATQCYSGDQETLNVGICHAGGMICEDGKWGNYPEDSEVFVDEYCLGEQLPLEEDLCSGQDDNCDGLVDKEITETDILFIVDTSGSMSNTINAVQSAMSMFSATYSDEEVIQWGLVVGPLPDGIYESLELVSALVPFPQFLPTLNSLLASYMTGEEMLLDALYLALLPLVDPADILMTPAGWDWNIKSTPSLQNFTVNWREDANKVIVVFSDEPAQSFLNPEVTGPLVSTTAQSIDDLFIYTFSTYGGKSDWEPLAINGSWFELTTNPSQMFDNLMEILDETACGNVAP